MSIRNIYVKYINNIQESNIISDQFALLLEFPLKVYLCIILSWITLLTFLILIILFLVIVYIFNFFYIIYVF